MTKKYFGTDGIRGKFGDSVINPEFILKLGFAIGRVFANGQRKKILIGKDTRISGYLLESALEAGLSAAGVDINLLGPMPTPAIAYLTRTFRAQAGIVISASHNPYTDNGIKFFAADGRKLADEVEYAIEDQLAKPMRTVSSQDLGKALRLKDAPGRYIEFCKSSIPPRISLAGLKIVLDCANGATYHIAPNVFRELGAEVIELATDPDGFNINANCGSNEPAALQQSVLQQEADGGIAFDGDGDRVIMVDHKGGIVDGDELLFVIVHHRVREGKPVAGVAGTVMSNFGLEAALKALNVDFIRTPVGDRYVQAELFKRGWEYGGEASGHILCLGKTISGDGIISALQVLAAMVGAGESLHDLKCGMQKLPQAKINVRAADSEIVMRHPAIARALKDLKADLGDTGRVLLRPSGTEPLVRVMVEGHDEVKIRSAAEDLASVVAESAKLAE